MTADAGDPVTLDGAHPDSLTELVALGWTSARTAAWGDGHGALGFVPGRMVSEERGSVHVVTAAGGVSATISGVSGGGGTVTNALAGGNLPVAIEPPYLAVYFIIALTGIFPSRP